MPLFYRLRLEARIALAKRAGPQPRDVAVIAVAISLVDQIVKRESASTIA
jgi:hypothetical protein